MGMAIKRGIIIVAGLLLQILLSLAVALFFVDKWAIIHVVYNLVGLLITLYLIKDSKNYSYTLPWIVILLLFPLIGGLLYIILGGNKYHSKTLKSIRKHEKDARLYLRQEEEISESLKKHSPVRYLTKYAGYPATSNNLVDYYPVGEQAFKVMLQELQKAKKFIFFEYFIVARGKMWNSILEILKQKAKEGVEVRVMYDDLGCMTLLHPKYPQELEKMGIKCVCFNRLGAFAGVIMNNRDHRKMLIIDGKIAFSGGINIADEYINVGSKYGHWKDNGIRIVGEAVWNYTVMFLTMWNSFRDEDDDYTKFKYNFKKDKKQQPGLVIPYGDSPLDNEITGEDVYLNIIGQANDYIYIFTPYLIIDTDMINALTLAAKRGVDVRLIIPGIPDKKLVYTVSESYVEPLVAGGVKVYRYTPGFVHAKVFVSDDNVATVGTINLDYRSLYLHFECGCYLQDVPVIAEIKQDLVDAMTKSSLITKQEACPHFFKAFWQALLRLVAPLM